MEIKEPCPRCGQNEFDGVFCNACGYLKNGGK